MSPTGSPGRSIRLPLRSHESTILTSLVGELRELVAAPAVRDDPLEAWQAELAAGPIDHSDPVVARLFPPGSTEPSLDAEYRRLTETGLRTLKDRDARIVLADLAADPGQATGVDIRPDRVTAWLRTLNALRLALAGRLGVTSAAAAAALERLAPDDPRSDATQVYDWLSYLLEVILAELMAD